VQVLARDRDRRHVVEHVKLLARDPVLVEQIDDVGRRRVGMEHQDLAFAGDADDGSGHAWRMLAHDGSVG